MRESTQARHLALDLLVGRWELPDSQTHRLSHLRAGRCLLLTLLFEPGGWLLYLALRAVWWRRHVAAGAETM